MPPKKRSLEGENKDPKSPEVETLFDGQHKNSQKRRQVQGITV